MRRILLIVLILGFAASPMAQQAPSPAAVEPEPALEAAPGPDMTQGEFALLLLEVLATRERPVLTPAEALARAIALELVPADWHTDWLLTQGDLAEVVRGFGIEFQPAAPDTPVSEAFAEALLRRHRAMMQRFGQAKATHGQSQSLVADEGVDRAVSPSAFQ